MAAQRGRTIVFDPASLQRRDGRLAAERPAPTLRLDQLLASGRKSVPEDERPIAARCARADRGQGAGKNLQMSSGVRASRHDAP